MTANGMPRVLMKILRILLVAISSTITEEMMTTKNVTKKVRAREQQLVSPFLVSKLFHPLFEGHLGSTISAVMNVKHKVSTAN